MDSYTLKAEKVYCCEGKSLGWEVSICMNNLKYTFFSIFPAKKKAIEFAKDMIEHYGVNYFIGLIENEERI
jgi:hypothetical protein